MLTIIFMMILSAVVYGDRSNGIWAETAGEPADIQKIIMDSVDSYQIGTKEKVYLFRPSGDPHKKYPVILFYPRYRSLSPREYAPLIEHIVNRGMVVVYAPYRRISFTRKQIMRHTITLSMFEETVKAARPFIDTTKIGFIGHSFGGGIIPALARKVLMKKKWGDQGAFLYLMAPWYFHDITIRELRNYPSKVNVLVQVFDDDNINDPRIAAQLFSLMGVPLQQKRFFIVYSDQKGDYRLKADNNVPLGAESVFGEDNWLDQYAVCRIFDAGAFFTFDKNKAGQSLAFGKDSVEKVSMGMWPDSTPVKPMIATDTPHPFLSLKPYLNGWNSIRNPFVDLTRFRKVRKVYTKHIKDKVKKLGTHIALSNKKKKDNDRTLDIMENPILTGYGAEGPFTVAVDSVASPGYSGAFIHFFYPQESKEPAPVIFLVHGYSGPDYLLYHSLIYHMVSRGYAVLFSPYPILPYAGNEKRVLEKYDCVFLGMEKAVTHFKQKIDTTRIGFFGQSFGGGAVPSLAYKAIVNKQWGSRGAFLYITAPWFCFGITQEQLQSFPSQTKLIMEVFDDDMTNDHQIAIDIFTSIAIAPAEKDFITLYSDSFNGYTMQANHTVPVGIYSIYGEENLLDYYGIFRLVDALADYSFTNNQKAKTIALGNGNPQQCFMGQWAADRPVKPLTVSDSPVALHSEMHYLFSWDNALNPRRFIYREKLPLYEIIKTRIVPSISQ